MRDPDRIKRYTLVPRSSPGAERDGIRRFTLARVGASPRSALGADRLERMERIAESDSRPEPASRDGGDPSEPPTGEDGPQERRS